MTKLKILIISCVLFLAIPSQSADAIATYVISGVLSYKNGNFVPGEVGYRRDGNPSTAVPGSDVLVSLLDKTGHVLSEISTPTSVRLLVNYDGKTHINSKSNTTDRFPIRIELPANLKATTLQVSKAGKIVSRVALNGQILEGLISELALNDNAQSENLLKEKVKAIQVELNSPNPRKAVPLIDKLISKIKELAPSSGQQKAVPEIEKIKIQLLSEHDLNH